MTGSEHLAAIRKTLRAKLAAESPRTGPNLQWAEKILQRYQKGERICDYALRTARSALGADTSRAPGEDDE